MKKVTKKLKSSVGESLTESLVAILIFTLSSIMLLSMIATAAKINYQAKQNTEKMNDELYYAEAQNINDQDSGIQETGVNDSIIVKVDEDSANVPVVVYPHDFKDNGKLYSFAWEVTTSIAQ